MSTHTFDVSKYCAEDIASAGVDCYIARNPCTYKATLKTLGMTVAEFKEAVADAIKNISGLKLYPHLITVGEMQFCISVNKCGKVCLTKYNPNNIRCFDNQQGAFYEESDFCIDDAAVILTAPEAGGTWSGTGVVPFGDDFYFDPGTSGIGTFVITYTKGAEIWSQTMTVSDLPVVTLAPLGSVGGEPLYLVPFGTPAGGTFYCLATPAAVVGDYFYGSIAGLGDHLIHYVYENPQTGCSSFATSTVTVTAVDGGELRLDSSSPMAIDDILGFSAVDASVNGKRSLNSAWLAQMLLADFKFADPYADPTVLWKHDEAGGDGYNFRQSEAVARGKTLTAGLPTTVLDGVGDPATPYGFNFLTQDYAVYLPLISTLQSVCPINLATAMIQVIGTNPVNVAAINFTPLFNEIDFFYNTMVAAGIVVRRFQLSTELGIQNQNDIVHTAADVANVCAVVIARLNSVYPGIPISVDAYEVDDPQQYLPNYNSTLNALAGVTGARQYFQFKEELTTYALNRARIAELTAYLASFKAVFPGKKLIFQQEVIKEGNPMKLKNGEALVFTEFAMKCLTENLSVANANLISDLTFYNVTRLIGGNGTVYPALKYIQRLRGMFINDGRIAYTFAGDSNLIIIPVKKGAESETYILNPTSGLIQIGPIYLDNVAQSVSVGSDSGNPTSSNTTQYSAAGTTALIYPYSLTKIVTL